MTDTPETPPTTAAETPTAPLPPTASYNAYSATPPAAAGDFNAQPPHHALGLHGDHHASSGAILVMVIGTLLLAMLAFGAGWATRGAVLRVQLAHGGVMMGQPFGRGFGGGQGYGQGQGQGYGQGYRHGFGRRGMMGTTPNGQLPGGQSPNGQVPGGSQVPSASPGAFSQ